MYERSLFIFRRDLRLEDNSALQKASEDSKAIIPAFILDPRQIGVSNRFRGVHSLRFMFQSLDELSHRTARAGGQLHLFHGKPHKIVERLIKERTINAVYVNRDYTPFSTARDLEIRNVCRRHQIPFHEHDDALLTAPEQMQKKDGSPYSIFTPFYRAAMRVPFRSTLPSIRPRFARLETHADAVAYAHLVDLGSGASGEFPGGRSSGLRRIARLPEPAEYSVKRNYPAEHATSGLSAHLKFGTVSVREVYKAIRDRYSDEHPVLRELYWRDFFTHIGFHHPRVFGHSFRSQYDSIQWHNNRTHFRRWCAGITGVPIVDAGIRQLNQTGFMHNRVRMIVASFLVKDLHVDWRWGEQYFAKQLADYDPCVNNGNWQWVASTGCDAAPYFRIFNPWLQQERYDPDCRYIKQWIPELCHLDARDIHQLHKQPKVKLQRYPSPIVEHESAVLITRHLYQSAQ